MSTFATKADATAWLARQRIAIERGEHVDPRAGRITLAAWTEQYLTAAVHKRKSTLARDRQALDNHVLPRLGHVQLNRIRRSDVDDLVQQLTEAGLAPGTIRTVVGVLRAVLNAAVRAEVIAASPARLVNLPPKTRTKVTVLTPDELGALAKAMTERYRPMIYLAGVLGLRWSEIAALRVQSIDTHSGKATITEALGQWGFDETKTSASRRTVLAPPFLADMLRKHAERFTDGRPTTLLFSTASGSRLYETNWHKAHWSKARRAAGLSLRFHDLRHSSVALAIAGGAHAQQIKERLGHASITTTFDTYGHLLTGTDELLAARLQSLFRRDDTDVSHTVSRPLEIAGS